MFCQTELVEDEILLDELYSPCRVHALGTYLGTFTGIVAVENAMSGSNKVASSIDTVIARIYTVTVDLGDRCRFPDTPCRWPS